MSEQSPANSQSAQTDLSAGTKTEEKNDVIADYYNDLKDLEIQQSETGVRKARNALYWTAGLIFAGEMIGMAQMEQGFIPLVLVIALIEAGIFIGLALWTRKKPYTAILTGLITFIVIIIFSAVVNGMAEGGAGVAKALFGGIIVKVVILVTLIKALSDARALQNAKKEKL